MDNKELSELYLASIKKDHGADAIKEILQS
jgi:hypothetical protein